VRVVTTLDGASLLLQNPFTPNEKTKEVLRYERTSFLM